MYPGRTHLIAQHGPLPHTPHIVTGSGGSHYYFRCPPGMRNKVNVGPGIDVRGEGGYVVAPPSAHASGRRYESECDFVDVVIAEPPAWLIEFVKEPPKAGTNGNAPSFAPVAEGARNDVAVRLTGHLIAIGADYDDVIALITAWNSRNTPPLEQREIETAVGNVWRRDQQQHPERHPGLAQWKQPQPLPEGLPPVIAFDHNLLPAEIRPWVTDIADRMQAPVDFVAVGAMVVIASVVGRRIGIRPKQHDDWLVVPNLWGALIGRPGVLKSPALAEVLKPLRRLEQEARIEYEAKVRAHEARCLVAEARRKQAEKAVREALEDGEDGEAAARVHLDRIDLQVPVRRRYVVNDSTVEKLGVLLSENPRGLLVFRDELVGVLRSLDRDGQEGARAFYLEAWSGDGRFTYDRIGRGTLDIPSTTLSMIGGIQPGPLGAYLQDATVGGSGDDGLMQRFQLAVWPDAPREWSNVDRWPDKDAKTRAFDLITKLNALDPVAVGASEDELGTIPYLRFGPDAQDLFDSWRVSTAA